MIWDDPWCVVARQPGGTALPPIRYNLAEDLIFSLLDRNDNKALTEWMAFVKTVLAPSDVLQRLPGTCHVPVLKKKDTIVATCVLRHMKQDLWMLESFTAVHGYGTPLLQQVMPILYKIQGGRFSLGFTWELTVWGLVGAWLKGWLSAAVSVKQGFVFKCDGDDKSKKGSTESKGSTGSTVTVCRSSQNADIGEISDFTGDPNWSLVGRLVGRLVGFKTLWMRSSVAPRGWLPSGEIIVLGCLNRRESQTVEWPTHAEI